MQILSLRKKDKFIQCELIDTNSAQIVALNDNSIKYIKNDIFPMYKKIIINEGNERKKYIKILGEELGDVIKNIMDKFDIDLGTKSGLALYLDDSTAELPWEISIIKKRPRTYFCEIKNIGRMRVYKHDGWIDVDRKHRRHKALIVGIDDDGQNEKLDFPENESKEISRILKDNNFSVKLLLGKNATNEKILNELRKGVDIFHFTGHGNMYRVDSTISTYQNEIKASNLEDMDYYPPRISFINACMSSVERIYKTSNWDPYTWATAFVGNGSEVFIGSLWPIEDETSSHFSINFYKKLFEKRIFTLGEAITKARESIKSKNDPYYTWLAYILYGNPEINIKSILAFT